MFPITFLGTRRRNSNAVTIRTLLLKDDKKNLKIREFIYEFNQIKEQMNGIFVQMCLVIKVQKFQIAFIAFNSFRMTQNLKPLKELDYNNLMGKTLMDYVNPVRNAKELKQLFDFKLERKIPARSSNKEIQCVFYTGKIENKFVFVHF